MSGSCKKSAAEAIEGALAPGQHLTQVLDALQSRHWNIEHTEPGQCPGTLIESLQQALPHIAPNSWTKRIAWGGAFLNGRAVRHDVPLQTPCRIEYFEPKFDIEKAADFFPPFKPAHILYEDQDVLVAYKPCGLPCLPGREQEHFNLKRYLTMYLHSRGDSASLHFPSRLDASAAGLVPVSKSARMHKALQQAYEQRRVEKVYRLETAGQPSLPRFTVEQPLGKDKRHPVLRCVQPSDGKPAQTDFTVLELRKSCWGGTSAVSACLLEARPRTGRTHQIRVHAAYAGLPLVGDPFYGGPPAQNLRLLSYQIGFFHPFLGGQFHLRLPQDMTPAWAQFEPGA